jgi:hypothetical protein
VHDHPLNGACCHTRNDKPWDDNALYTGSTTIIPNATGGPGSPIIIYAGRSRSAWGNAYGVAVPADTSDPLYKQWKKLPPAINHTDDDPTTAWRTPSGEWRLIGNGGGGQATPSNHGAPMWATTDPTLQTGWYSVGRTNLTVGECPSLYKLPPMTPGSAPLTAAERKTLPTHVHTYGHAVELGTWDDGLPGESTAPSAKSGLHSRFIHLATDFGVLPNY